MHPVVKAACSGVDGKLCSQDHPRAPSQAWLELASLIAVPSVFLKLRLGPDGKPPKPIEWLTDNGSFYTAAETVSFAERLGLKPVSTPVTSPHSDLGNLPVKMFREKQAN